MSLIVTKAALALKNAESNFEVVKYESHKPKKKALESKDTPESSDKVARKKELDLKRVRHEIVKFGMSGFDATKKEEAKIALAVSLGAKPPKREYVNYKDLMANRKKEKEKEKQEKQLMMAKTVFANKTKKKKSQNNDVGHLLSSYGKVQKKDLQSKETKGKGKKRKK
ncbi:uncharacterized protein C1orf131-like [Aricia agestis]|uniref:uncharacterized protein C1orf131-like n=1 Tax=Aricia agestis TaxID=91739 RepID=UPI001C204FB3|nr:uncharacterized protein C1orf131-like [Aricia agestis]